MMTDSKFKIQETGCNHARSTKKWPVTGDSSQIQDLRFKREAATMPINHQEIIEDIESRAEKVPDTFFFLFLPL
jgi:hypothetical protein